MADDVVFQSTTPATPAAGERVSAEEVTTLNAGAVTAQKVQRIALALRTADATAIDLPGDATNGLDVDVTRLPALAAGTNNIGDVDVLTLPALPAGTNNIGDVDVLSVPADPFGANADAASATGSISAKLRFIASTGIPITGTVTVGSHAVTNAGTFAVQAASAGDVAHDSADSGNPVKIGGVARTTNPTAVADADRVNATFDKIGRQAVVPYQVRDLTGHQHTQIASSSAETTIVTAGAAGVFHDLVALIITLQTATACTVTIRDSTAGTTRMVLQLAGAVGDIKGATFTVPVVQGTAANNWTAQLSSAAVTVNIFAQYIKNV